MHKLSPTEFDAVEFHRQFREYMADLEPVLEAEANEHATQYLQMITTLESNIDIMQRVDSDCASAGNDSVSFDDISQIGDYALNLISELTIAAANHGLQTLMINLTRLSIPVASWIAGHNGKIMQLDIVVNAIASYANELIDPEDLEQLCHYIESVMPAIDEEIKKDLEATNPMRPWRILNLNWGIVATRSHNAGLIDKVYAQLMQNIPADIHGFFTEAMQQMDIIGYPDNVRQIVSKYYSSLGYDQQLH